MAEHHIPLLSADEQLFLNTTASYSRARRMSHFDPSRPSVDDSSYGGRRHQSTPGNTMSFLWKRRDSSLSFAHPSMGSDDYSIQEDVISSPTSPKAKKLENLIFEQPRRTLRLSLTPGCAV
ncbi:hypothetical protein BY458DRAFT_519794 [Sporodiniella umbellata]|nr:hypothetical protein BY458DRAFT_519794 [Sporodiniella umbellata]